MTNEVTKARRKRPSRTDFDKVEAIADALIESDRMDCIARYLVAGRRFSNLQTADVERRWTEAVRIFLASYGSVNPGYMEDLDSELRLRKVPLPEESVRDQVAAVARRIRHGDDPEVVRERVRSFRNSLEGPQH